MDYAFVSLIINDLDAGIRQLLVTYNIACQWGINLRHCLSTYLPPLNLDLDKLSFHVTVPKFHLVGHGASCQGLYNLALMDGVGLTHGEGVETVWSHSTSLVTWSQENRPAACHQILDDHWGSWNWRKVVNLCKLLLCNSYRLSLTHMDVGINLQKTLKKAWKWSKAQCVVAKTLDSTVSKKTVLKWQKMVNEYKQDKRKPNPFKEPEISMSSTLCVSPLSNIPQLFPLLPLGSSSCGRNPTPRKRVLYNSTRRLHWHSCGMRWILKKNSMFLIYHYTLISLVPKERSMVTPPDSILK